MQRLLLVSALRFYLRQPWQLGLAIAGITLGVAAFVGIQNANRAAARSFEISTGLFGSGVTHRVIPAGRELPAGTYDRLVLAGFGNAVAPVASLFVENAARTGPGREIELIGIDPIKERQLRRFVPVGDGSGSALLRLLTERDTVLVPSGSRQQAGAAQESALRVSVNGATHELRIVGRYAPTGAGSAEPDVLITLIDTVLALEGTRRLSRIDLILDDGEVERIRVLLPPGAAVVDADDQNAELAAMTRAFTTNLTALGLLALLVGLFLIYATMAFTVVRRRPQIATLRALGVARAEVAAAIAVEAIVIGLVAGAAGGLLGNLLAGGLVDLALRTMDDLAFGRAVAVRVTNGATYPIAIAIGIAATLAAAVLPALEAASVAPASGERRSELEKRVRRRGGMLAIAAMPVLAIAAIVLLLSPRSLAFGFAGLFLVLVAGALCVPLFTAVLMRLLEAPARRTFGLAAVMAVRSVTASLSRTGVATAALAVAVATVISIGLMIGSFRTSLIAWIDRTLTADVYVLIDPAASDADGIAAWAESIRMVPTVTGISLTQRAVVPGPFGPVQIRAATAGPAGWGLDIVDAASADWSERLGRGDGIVIAEPYAYRHRLVPGATLMLSTPRGDTRLAILAIARDYNTAGAGIIMALDSYRQLWDDRKLAGIGVHLLPGTDPAAAAAAIDAHRPAGLDASLRSTNGIRDVSLLLFDRTFEITAVLRAVAGVVAFFGVLSAVLALQLERAHELAVLRSIGMSLGQLRLNVISQTCLLGLAAGLAAVPIGSVLAWLLVFVINKRAFGWSMEFELTAAPVAFGIGLAIIAASLAGFAAAFAGYIRRGAIADAPL